MSSKQKKILLLDDDYESMCDLEKYLRDELGWDVEFTADEGLLKRLGRRRFDLILVDQMIHPQNLDKSGQNVQNIHYENVSWRRTGLEFVRRLRKGEYTQKDRGTPPNVPIIILSAVADSAADEERSTIIKNEHHFEKPFRLSELIDLMRKLLQG